MINEIEILDLDSEEKEKWGKKVEDYGYVIARILDTLVILGTDPGDYCIKVDNIGDDRQSIKCPALRIVSLNINTLE